MTESLHFTGLALLLSLRLAQPTDKIDDGISRMF